MTTGLKYGDDGDSVKLGVTLAAVGLAGTLIFLAGAADVGNWDLYNGNPWILGVGGACFAVFVFGMYLIRKEINKRRKSKDTITRIQAPKKLQ